MLEKPKSRPLDLAAQRIETRDPVKSMLIDDAQSKSARLRALLPNVAAEDFNEVLASLVDNGALDRLFAAVNDPTKGQRVLEAFQAQIAAALEQSESGTSFSVDPWIAEFINVGAKENLEHSELGQGSSRDSENAETRNDKSNEWVEAVSRFDTILAKNPEILDRLKDRGIDLEAEKLRERDALRKANPGMPDVEVGTRSSITVYLRYQEDIRSVIPDGEARREIDASLAQLKTHAREAGIPYAESISRSA